MPALIAAAEAACAGRGVKALVGKIATGDLFVGDSETKAAIEAKCAPDCVEMEGAAVSQIAAKERRALRHSARHERQRRRGRPRSSGGEKVQHQRVCRHRHQDRGSNGGSALSRASPLYRNRSSWMRLSSSKSCNRWARRLEPGAASG